MWITLLCYTHYLVYIGIHFINNSIIFEIKVLQFESSDKTAKFEII